MLVSMEGQALVETQSTALFGDIRALTRQMQEAVGQDVSSMEEVMQRVEVCELCPPDMTCPGTICQEPSQDAGRQIGELVICQCTYPC